MSSLKNKSWSAIPGHVLHKPAPAQATGKPSEKAAGQILGDRVKGKPGPKTKPPRGTDVESSNILSVAYRDGDLFVKFRSLGHPCYRYKNAPKEIYDEMLSANEKGESVGDIFNDKVVGEYEAVKL